MLEVSVSTVSAWERGDYEPTSEKYLALGNIAPYPDSLWFWEKAGMKPSAMLSASERLMEERNVALPAAEIVRIPVAEMTADGLRETSEFVAFPSRWLPHPASTKCLTVGGNPARTGGAFAPGSVLLIDESDAAGATNELSSLIGKVVAFEFPERGVFFGRLRLLVPRLYQGQLVQLRLGPVVLQEGIGRGLEECGSLVGEWSAVSAPEEPISGGKWEQARQRLEEAKARFQELDATERALRSEASRGGTESYRETDEIVEAKRERMLAQQSLLGAERAEKAFRESEAGDALWQEARLRIRLLDGRVLGTLVAWFPPAEMQAQATSSEEAAPVEGDGDA